MYTRKSIASRTIFQFSFLETIVCIVMYFSSSPSHTASRLRNNNYLAELEYGSFFSITEASSRRWDAPSTRFNELGMSCLSRASSEELMVSLPTLTDGIDEKREKKKWEHFFSFPRLRWTYLDKIGNCHADSLDGPLEIWHGVSILSFFV